jgi:hypothetical protein
MKSFLSNLAECIFRADIEGLLKRSAKALSVIVPSRRAAEEQDFDLSTPIPDYAFVSSIFPQGRAGSKGAGALPSSVIRLLCLLTKCNMHLAFSGTSRWP